MEGDVQGWPFSTEGHVGGPLRDETRFSSNGTYIC